MAYSDKSVVHPWQYSVLLVLLLAPLAWMTRAGLGGVVSYLLVGVVAAAVPSLFKWPDDEPIDTRALSRLIVGWPIYLAVAAYKGLVGDAKPNGAAVSQAVKPAAAAPKPVAAAPKPAPVAAPAPKPAAPVAKPAPIAATVAPPAPPPPAPPRPAQAAPAPQVQAPKPQPAVTAAPARPQPAAVPTQQTYAPKPPPAATVAPQPRQPAPPPPRQPVPPPQQSNNRNKPQRPR